MLFMVIISGQGTMRSPRRLFPDRHQRIACVCLLRIRASVIPSTYYSAVLIVLYRCNCSAGKTVNSTWNRSTVGLFMFLFVAWASMPCAIESTLHSYSRAPSKTGQHLHCTCAKCWNALFLVMWPTQESYEYYILYIGEIGRLTKLLEIEIVITVGMRFSDRIWGIPKCSFTGSACREVWVGGKKLK